MSSSAATLARNSLFDSPRRRMVPMPMREVWSSNAATGEMGKVIEFPPRPSTSPDMTNKRSIVRHTLCALASIMSPDPTDGDFETAIAALLLVKYLVEDNSATPQVSPGPEGGVSIEWFVKRRSLNIQVLSEGEIYSWAEDSLGNEVFEYELTSKWSPSEAPVQEIKAFLEDMSRDVRQRVDLKH